MSTTLFELQRWMNAPREDEHLEFKQAKTSYDTTKLTRYCVAIGNEGGGKLVLGITDGPPRQIVGTLAFENPGAIQTLILNKVGFRVDVEELDHPDGRVLIFHIPPRPRGTAYQHDGAYLMRSGENLVSMTEDRLRKIFSEGRPDFLSELATDHQTADDVVRLLHTQSYFDMMKLPYPTTRDAVLERLQSERLIARDDDGFGITNLAALLFAKSLNEFLTIRRKAPRVIVYQGQGKLSTRLDQTGTMGYAVGFEGLIGFIDTQVKTNEIVGKALRTEVKMFPRIAIRELVANALIHQDFDETGASVMIELYDDRMEISNPGKPFIPVERFIDEYQSRNERLADLMRRMGVCEEKGSGVDQVIASVEHWQLPAPDFRVGERRTTAVLFSHQEFEAMTADDKARACYQHCVLHYVMNQKMTNQSLRERFKLSAAKSESVSRIIRDAVERGLVKLDDPTNTSKRYAKYVPHWA
jgi:ATP-dependent DNA helicase RecG